MTREIKFRGKRLDNGEWICGDLIENQGRFFIYHATSESTIEDNDNGRISIVAVEVDPATVGQYTGLKDKNGREIYEDDIMNLGDRKGRIGYVGYSEVHPAFMFVTRHVDFVLFSRNSERQYEVIGNLHDNPEMLKK